MDKRLHSYSCEMVLENGSNKIMHVKAYSKDEARQKFSEIPGTTFFGAGNVFSDDELSSIYNEDGSLASFLN